MGLLYVHVVIKLLPLSHNNGCLRIQKMYQNKGHFSFYRWVSLYTKYSSSDPSHHLWIPIVHYHMNKTIKKINDGSLGGGYPFFRPHVELPRPWPSIASMSAANFQSPALWGYNPIYLQALLEMHALPRALSKGYTTKISSAKIFLSSAFCRALGKGFAECHDGTRQRKVAMIAHGTLTDSLPCAPLLGTRQRIFYFF
jgi:hypothetical protein